MKIWTKILIILILISACDDNQSIDYDAKVLDYKIKIEFRPAEKREIPIISQYLDSITVNFRRYPKDSTDVNHYFTESYTSHPIYLNQDFFENGRFSMQFNIKNDLGIQSYLAQIPSDTIMIYNAENTYHWLIQVKRRNIVSFLQSDTIPEDLASINLYLQNSLNDSLRVDTIVFQSSPLKITSLPAGKFDIRFIAVYADSSMARITQTDQIIGFNVDSVTFAIDSLFRKSHD